MIFQGQQPIVTQPSGLQMVGMNLLYNLNATSSSQIDIYASAFEYPSSLGCAAQPKEGLFQLLDDYSNNFLTKVSDLPLEVFSYRQAIATLKANYVVICDLHQIPRFSKDPLFSCVFANKEVSIFQIQTQT